MTDAEGVQPLRPSPIPELSKTTEEPPTIKTQSVVAKVLHGPKLFVQAEDGKTHEITIPPHLHRKFAQVLNTLNVTLDPHFEIDLAQLVATIQQKAVFFNESVPQIQQLRQLISQCAPIPIKWPRFLKHHRTANNLPSSFQRVSIIPSNFLLFLKRLGVRKTDLTKFIPPDEYFAMLMQSLGAEPSEEPDWQAKERRKKQIAVITKLLETMDLRAVLFILLHPSDLYKNPKLLKSNVKRLCQKAEAFLDACGGDTPVNRMEYIQDLVRLNCRSRAEYNEVSTILQADLRKDGPELFFAKLCTAKTPEEMREHLFALTDSILDPLDQERLCQRLLGVVQ